MNKITKSTALLFVVALMISASSTLSARGSSTGGEDTITLTIAGRDGSYGEAMQLAADSYSQANPKVSFDILKLSGSSLFEKTVVEMKSNSGAYDIILIDDPNITLYQKADWLADLGAMYQKDSSSVDSNFIASALRLGRYPYNSSGRLTALPFAGNVELFAYRTDLFEKYGFGEPTKWSELLKAVKTIDKGESGVNGVLFRGSKGNPIVTGFLPIFWAFGGKILNGNNVTVNSREGVAALKFYLELSKYAPKGVSSYQSAQVTDALLSGAGAVAIEVWPGWISSLEDPAKSSVVGKVKVTKHPGEAQGSSPMIGIWMAAIPKSSEHQKAAFDFLKYLTSYDTQLLMSEQAGLPPTREDVYQVASLKSKYPWYEAQLDALNNGVARTRTTKWKEIEDRLGTALQLALLGELSAEEAMAQAKKEIKAVVQ